MLAALIANNQNVVLHKTNPDHTRVDRSAGKSSWARFQATDFADALRMFPERAGEHPVARAQRRARWIGETLPGIREARERREARAFLLGAEVGARAAEARHQEQEQAKIDAQPKIDAPAPRRPDPEADKAGLGTVLALVGVGVGIGLVIARGTGRNSRSRRRRRW